MSKFDNAKDSILFKSGWKTWENTRMRLEIHSYDKKEPRVQITRQRRNDEDSDWGYTKPGRMDYEEAKFVGKILRKKVIPWLEEYFSKHGTGKKK